MRMCIRPMAGNCMEPALWQMIRDLTKQMIDGDPLKFSVSDVFIEADLFCINSETVVDEKAALQYLGALIVFMSSGHEVFGGRGIEYLKDHKEVRFPVLCKEHSRITPLIHACLKGQTGLQQLFNDATIGFEDCCNTNTQRKKKNIGQIGNTNTAIKTTDSWPEEME